MAEIAPPTDDSPARFPGPPRPPKPSLLRRILGPHLGKSVENIGELATFLGPGQDVALSMEGSRQITQGIENMSLQDILLGAGSSIAGIMGAAIPGPPPTMSQQFARSINRPYDSRLIERALSTRHTENRSKSANLIDQVEPDFVVRFTGTTSNPQSNIIHLGESNRVGVLDLPVLTEASAFSGVRTDMINRGVKQAVDNLDESGILVVRVKQGAGRDVIAQVAEQVFEADNTMSLEHTAGTFLTASDIAENSGVVAYLIFVKGAPLRRIARKLRGSNG